MNARTPVLLAAGLVVAAAATGGWWGHHVARSSATAPLQSPSGELPTAHPTAPAIALPRPLATQATPEPAAMAGHPAEPSAGAPADIVPGGAVAGNAVSRMWETNANQAWQVRPEPLTPRNWYITGVVQRGDKTQIIVQFDGEPMPRFLKIGDVLPGGGKLAWVRPGAIGVLTPGKKRIGVPVLPETSPPAPAASQGPDTPKAPR